MRLEQRVSDQMEPLAVPFDRNPRASKRRPGMQSGSPERLCRLELQLTGRQTEVADGALIEQRDLSSRARAAIPFDQQSLGQDVLHGTSQAGGRRTLYPAGAGYF